jgi:hypothetical protein
MQLIKKSFLTEEELDIIDIPNMEVLRDVCIELTGGAWTPRRAQLSETYLTALLAGGQVHISPAPNEQAVTYDLVGSP